MDVALLSRIIAELVLDQDSLGVPGLGTFVTELVPSTFSDKGYTIHPPYRRLSFIQKSTEDGLLTARLAKENVSWEELSGFLFKLKEELKLRKAIALPGLGRLRATRENHFFFVPDENLDIYPAGFGLESISLKNHQESLEEIASAVSSLADAVNSEEIPPLGPSDLGLDDNDGISSEPDTPVISEEPDSPVISEEPDSPVISSGTRRAKSRNLIIILVIIAAIAALAFAALAILGRVAPDFVDRLLYSPHELQTLKSLNL